MPIRDVILNALLGSILVAELAFAAVRLAIG
jgi:hypothetical protein